MSGDASFDPIDQAAAEPAVPSEPAQQRYRYVRLKPHRGNTVLGLGISGVVLAVFGSMMALSLYICCPVWLLPLGSLGLSIPAWRMGQADLAAMHAMEMDPSGKDLTTIGMMCGIIGVSIIALGATSLIFIIVFYAAMIGISAATS
jgi:hypothetical protein